MTKKLIILTGSCPISALGGAGRVINSYFNHYKKNKYQFIFLPIHTRSGYRIFRIRPLFFSFFKAFWIRIKFRKYKVVLHHHHTTIYDFFAFLLIKSATGITKSNCLITFHNPKYFAIIDHLKKVSEKKTQNFSKFTNPIKLKFLHIYFKFVNRLFKNFHFLNSLNHEAFKDLISPEAKVKVSPNPLDEVQIKIIKKNIKEINKEVNKSKVIGTYSLMRKGKRLDRAIEMMAILPPDYSLLIGGKGPEESNLKKQVKKLNLESRIKFLGWMDNKMKNQFFKIINIFLITSDADTHSLVFLEAIINKMPVISVPNPVFKEIYPEGICANYSKNFKPASLAEEIILYDKKRLSTTISSKYIFNQQKYYTYAEDLLN